ncbi:uncharacterized protein CIMG_06059 [Coccidioides immitis RS]|uniref:Uncharacterized protein n=1 Tax=Coccidioides immitis (strain RS) TaxID=246410 RepID=J3K7B9_COCIM|nr:uncharacterized protein CIMG_06059 [Coccidioides immitis RS]EAS30580.3 hypothetical protein CIMG_06059 [Coccidioides immitis RS]
MATPHHSARLTTRPQVVHASSRSPSPPSRDSSPLSSLGRTPTPHPFAVEMFGPSGIAARPPPPGAVVVAPAPASNFMVNLSRLWLLFPLPRQDLWVPWSHGVLGTAQRPPRPPARDQQWWSQTTFNQLLLAAFFTGSSRANPVVLPGLPPHTEPQALSARERAWCCEPIQRPVLIAGLDNPNQLAVRAQLCEEILVT